MDPLIPIHIDLLAALVFVHKLISIIDAGWNQKPRVVSSSAWQANDTLVIRGTVFMCVPGVHVHNHRLWPPTISRVAPKRASWYTGAEFLRWRIDCSWCDSDVYIYIYTYAWNMWTLRKSYFVRGTIFNRSNI